MSSTRHVAASPYRTSMELQQTNRELMARVKELESGRVIQQLSEQIAQLNRVVETQKKVVNERNRLFEEKKEALRDLELLKIEHDQMVRQKVAEMRALKTDHQEALVVREAAKEIQATMEADRSRLRRQDRQVHKLETRLRREAEAAAIAREREEQAIAQHADYIVQSEAERREVGRMASSLARVACIMASKVDSGGEPYPQAQARVHLSSKPGERERERSTSRSMERRHSTGSSFMWRDGFSWEDSWKGQGEGPWRDLDIGVDTGGGGGFDGVPDPPDLDEDERMELMAQRDSAIAMKKANKIMDAMFDRGVRGLRMKRGENVDEAACACARCGSTIVPPLRIKPLSWTPYSRPQRQHGGGSDGDWDEDEDEDEDGDKGSDGGTDAEDERGSTALRYLADRVKVVADALQGKGSMTGVAARQLALDELNDALDALEGGWLNVNANANGSANIGGAGVIRPSRGAGTGVSSNADADIDGVAALLKPDGNVFGLAGDGDGDGKRYGYGYGRGGSQADVMGVHSSYDYIDEDSSLALSPSVDGDREFSIEDGVGGHEQRLNLNLRATVSPRAGAGSGTDGDDGGRYSYALPRRAATSMDMYTHSHAHSVTRTYGGGHGTGGERSRGRGLEGGKFWTGMGAPTGAGAGAGATRSSTSHKLYDKPITREAVPRPRRSQAVASVVLGDLRPWGRTSETQERTRRPDGTTRRNLTRSPDPRFL